MNNLLENVLVRLREIADDHYASAADAALALEAMRDDINDLIELVESAVLPTNSGRPSVDVIPNTQE